LSGSALSNGELLFEMRVPFDFSYNCDAASNRFISTANPGSNAAFLVKRGSTTLCTITVSSSGTLSFSGAGGSFSFASNDVLNIYGPATADSSLLNPSLTIVVHRQ
jgi:hypothetical protein